MKDLSFLKQNLIAHRGFHNIQKGIPENSLPAFKKAIDNGYLIELDLHILKDNSVVVFHDDNLNRMTGVDKNLKDVSYDEIKNLKLQNTDTFIPLFKDVLRLVNGKVPIIIELKTDVRCGILEPEVMKILNNYSGLYAIKSFSPFSVLWFKKHFPNVTRGFLSCNFSQSNMFSLKKKFLNSQFLFNLLGIDFLSYDIHSLPCKAVENFRRNKLVLGWTILSKSDLEHAKKYCDNFICENIL